MNKNDFDEKAMKVFAKFFTNMNTCEILDISENITDDSNKALKILLEGLVQSKCSLRELNISNNKSINCEGTVELLQQLMTDNLQLKVLNISNLGMNKVNCDKMITFLTGNFKK